MHDGLRSRAALLWTGALLCAALCACQASPPSERWRSEAAGGAIELPEPLPGAPGRVLLVSVAGLTPDLYLEPDSPMPVLRDLARAGLAAERLVAVHPDTPFPTLATLVTGRSPAGHGIVADHLIGERGVRRVKYWHASRIEAPTLWERAREAGVEVASLGWTTTVGAGIPLLVPDVGVTRAYDSWLALQRQTATPRLYERINQLAPPEARDPGSTWPDADDRDALVTSLACELLAEPNAPQLYLLRLAGAEEPLRRGGPRAPGLARALAGVDARIGRLVGCLADAGLLRSTALLIAGDRAMRPVHTVVRPNAMLVEADLVQLTEDERAVDSWIALSRSNGGSAFVYASDEKAAVEARRVLGEFSTGSRTFRVVPATELQAYRADPQAWFGLEAEPGFVFDDEAVGSAIAPAPWRGDSGYLRSERRGDPGWVAWGQGLRAGLDVPEVHMQDIAPTVAMLLEVDLVTDEGRPLVGLIDVRRAQETTR